jgi:hypothetical protein
MDGVLAHEITHAKLVQRGYKRWLNRGLGRMGKLAQSLHAHTEAFRKSNNLVAPAPTLFRVADGLTRWAAQLVAACSRQDEFDADRGAAELCGAGAIRSSLLKLGPLEERVMRLPWNERVARLQAGEGFSGWLLSELKVEPSAQTQPETKNLFFKYSTHPSLADRLAALPADEGGSLKEIEPAIRLLKDPEKVAERLISEIQRVSAEQELKDSRRLRRWTRKSLMRAQLRPLQAAGVALALIGAGVGFFGWLAGEMSWGLAGCAVGVIFLGALGHRFGGYRDRLTLSAPSFTSLKSGWQDRPQVNDEQVKQLEAVMQKVASNNPNRRKRELALAQASYDALERCDYVRAHVAARYCLQANSKSIEGCVGLAVAAAALGQVQQVQQAIAFVAAHTGMSARSVRWGSAWALALCGDWASTEALLEKLHQQNRDNATYSLMLALCRSNRGKLQTALLLAREVCQTEPVELEHRKFLVDLLLRAGYLREAKQHLIRVESAAAQDPELLLMQVKVNLLLGNYEAAESWTESLKKQAASAHWFVSLGHANELARQDVKAVAYYDQALSRGFYPEALMGLARVEARARNKDKARAHLMSALNTERTLGEKAAGPLPLFHHILSQMLSLEDPVPACRAWVASLNGSKSPPGLLNRALMVHAQSRQEAEGALGRLFSAMQPSIPPLATSSIGWAEAPAEEQPDGPVRPGVQGVVS